MIDDTKNTTWDTERKSSLEPASARRSMAQGRVCIISMKERWALCCVAINLDQISGDSHSAMIGTHSGCLRPCSCDPAQANANAHADRSQTNTRA